jgi:GPN-loop GTPase
MKIGDEDLLLAANRDADFEFMGSTAFAQEEYIDKFHERS